MSHTKDNIDVPETITPWGELIFWNGMVLAVIWVICSILLFPFMKWGPVWALLITMAALGMLISSGAFAADVEDWFGAVVFNRFTKKRRAMFPGFHGKLPWEYLEEPPIPLKREITKQKKVALPTNDPTETMEVDLMVHLRFNTTGKPEKDSDNLIRFQSVEANSLEEIVFGEIVKMFAAYYSTKKEKGEMENLLDARKVQKAVLIDDDTNHERIHQLEENYGVIIKVVLKSSNPDERTKKLKETPARAEALLVARHKLMAVGPNKEAGMEQDKARRAALLLDDVAQYSEQHLTLEIDAKGLENLRDVNVIPPGTFGGGKKGDKK
jgi:hypothetical protein